MSKPYNAHVNFDDDTSEYLKKISDKTGWSVCYVANQLVRMMEQMEIETSLTLKTDTLIGKEGRPIIKYKPRFRIAIKR